MPIEINGKMIEVLGLKRGQIKTLRAEGIELGKMMDMDEEARDSALDRLIEMACPEVDPDDITPGQALELYTEISERTYLTGEQVKKSGSPQSST